jgi:NADH dehydrogenase (ubiquinone) Fe-S protein 3
MRLNPISTSTLLCNWQRHVKLPAMAMRAKNSRALASALRSTRTALTRRNDATIRSFTSTRTAQVVVSADTPNMRYAQRSPDAPGGLRVPPVNPADKYAAKSDDMHRYGAWLMGCLPKYVQQFSVWKDELVIYISPAGVIPVFSFLKCTDSVSMPFLRVQFR